MLRSAGVRSEHTGLFGEERREGFAPRHFGFGLKAFCFGLEPAVLSAPALLSCRLGRARPRVQETPSELHQILLVFHNANVRDWAGPSTSQQHPEGQAAPGCPRLAPSQRLAPAVRVLKRRRNPQLYPAPVRVKASAGSAHSRVTKVKQISWCPASTARGGSAGCPGEPEAAAGTPESGVRRERRAGPLWVGLQPTPSVKGGEGTVRGRGAGNCPRAPRANGSLKSTLATRGVVARGCHPQHPRLGEGQCVGFNSAGTGVGASAVGVEQMEKQFELPWIDPS